MTHRSGPTRHALPRTTNCMFFMVKTLFLRDFAAHSEEAIILAEVVKYKFGIGRMCESFHHVIDVT